MANNSILKEDSHETKFSMKQTIGTLLALIFSLDKTYYPMFILATIVGVANSVVTLFIPKFLIDFVQGKILSEQGMLVIVILVVVKFILLFFLSMLDYIMQNKSHVLNNELPMQFAKKTMSIHYHYLEDPDILDLKERALFPLTTFGAAYSLFSSLLESVRGVFILLSVILILLQFSWIFTLLIIAISLISFLLSKSFLKFMQKVMGEMIPINRRLGYVLNSLILPPQQKNLRIYPLNEVLMQNFKEFNVEIFHYLKNINSKQANVNSIQAILDGLSQFLIYAYVAIRIFSDQFGAKISVGDFSLYVSAADRLFNSINTTIKSLLNVWQMLSYLQPFCEFMNLPEKDHQVGDRKAEAFESLEFKNVHFQYPNSEVVVLDDVSFTLTKNEKLSIVGLNNAGKSTMVKLICRLYDVDSGAILWNGKNINDYDYKSYIDQISTVFQDFVLFPFTIYENIDTSADIDSGEPHKEEVWKILKQVQMDEKIQVLPSGISTYLNKSLNEDATEFSGGESQKLAIARSLFKRAELVILDEPTAALDPLAEAEVYENFYSLTQGKTAIFISHRMSSSLFCDKILLLQDGKIQACDSHENLMKEHNLYRDLFMAQAQNYQS